MASVDGIVTKFDPAEKSRTYVFPNGSVVVLKDITELIVRPSGTHRLKTADGHSHIIPAGWIHIELEINDWSV